MEMFDKILTIFVPIFVISYGVLILNLMTDFIFRKKGNKFNFILAIISAISSLAIVLPVKLGLLGL